MEITESEISPEQQALYEEVGSFIKECTTIPKKAKTIYQYTNIEALFNGIIAKETKNVGSEICLWASNYLYMNDPSEIATGQKYVDKILKEYFIEDDDDKDIQDKTDDVDYYITSFSMTGDSLPMWSMYGKNGAGIALGFDRAIIEKVNPSLYRCSYLDDKLKNKITKFCEKMKGEKISQEVFGFVFIIAFFALLLNDDKKQREKMIDSFLPFLLFMTYAKDPAYKYEDEVRLLIHSDENSEIKYRAQNNLIIPYIDNYFPKEALTTVVVGPTNDMKRTVKSIDRYLKSKGFNNLQIIESKVPYRG
ncbi:MAG: DUF2971 domain-containing protein [Oscillospiraceae bacterium]